MDTLTVTKDRVLEAAEKCSTSKEVLKALFPEAFSTDKYFDLTKLKLSWSSHDIFTKDSVIECGLKHGILIQGRTYGDYAYHGFFLTATCDWNIVTDNTGDKILVPTKKS